MSTNGASVDLAAHIGPVAGKLLGEPNRTLSNGRELRYGTHGSLSVDIEKGTWFDHENKQGGGVLDLVQRERNCDRRDAINWLKKNAGLEGEPPARAKPDKQNRHSVVARYVYHDAGGDRSIGPYALSPGASVSRGLRAANGSVARAPWMVSSASSTACPRCWPPTRC
jgi:hypothetical protein